MDFDATDVDQLNAFVPASLGRAIDAARYSSLGDFGSEICWEALPPIFALSNGAKSKRHGRSDLAERIDDVPLLSELTEEQQRIVTEYLEEHRGCSAGGAAMHSVEEVAARADLCVASPPPRKGSLIDVLTLRTQTPSICFVLSFIDLNLRSFVVFMSFPLYMSLRYMV
jgi:hypothetical protein